MLDAGSGHGGRQERVELLSENRAQGPRGGGEHERFNGELGLLRWGRGGVGRASAAVSLLVSPCVVSGEFEERPSRIRDEALPWVSRGIDSLLVPWNCVCIHFQCLFQKASENP